MPAETRLRQLFDSDPSLDLYPPSAPKSILESFKLTDLISRTVFPDDQVIVAGQGVISGYPTILAVVHPYAVPQRVHFATLLVSLCTALQTELPLTTVYSNNALPKSAEIDQSTQSELSFAEATYLTIEMERLSEVQLPHITVLTDMNVDGKLSTQFPLGDFVLAERNEDDKAKLKDRLPPSSQQVQSPESLGKPEYDAFVDHYSERQDLPEMIGQLLSFFAKS
jgi:acetyl-CoA carboxylase beta subunit